MLKFANQKSTITCILTLIIFLSIISCSSIVYLRKFDFDDNRALDKWGKMILNGQVKYLLLKSGDNGYVEAASDKACSALYYRIGYKLKDYPLLTWKWKVVKFPDKSRAATEKEKDDYAGRVYVIFPFLNFSSSKFIEYVWDETMPDGTIRMSPKADNIRVIVTHTGKGDAEQWIEESRNVYEDYAKAFGKPPNRGVGAIAIMCDADDTKTAAEGIFDDIAIVTDTGIKRRLD